MFHVRGSICLGSKIHILKEMFARGNVNHLEEWVERKRYNFNSPWHGREKSAAIICQKERLQIYEEQRDK